MTWIRPSDTGMLPEPRAGHSCCVTKNNVVYICGGGDSENDKLFNDLYQLDTGYFTTDEKQISKLIYHQKTRVVRKGQAQKSPPVRLPGGTTRNVSGAMGHRGHRHSVGRDGRNDSHRAVASLYIPNHQMSPKSTSPTSYEDEQGQFRQSNFMQHAQNFVNRRDEQYGGPRNYDVTESPLMAAGVISDDIASISQEIDVIINTVELGIKHKINEFKQKEQGYIMILRSIEAERSKLIDDVNRDVTMLKFSVKESLDKLQQKFIAKMLRKHVDYVTEQSAVGTASSNGAYSPSHQNEGNTNLHKASVQVPLRKPSLGVIQEEQDESKEKRKDSRSRSRSRSNSAGNVADDEKVENVPEGAATDSPQANGDGKMQELQQQQSPTEVVPQRKARTPPHIQKDAPNIGANTLSAPSMANKLKNPSIPASPPLNGSIPESSQSPNPTRNALRQQEDSESNEKEKGSFINQALKRQAEFQQNQSRAQYYVKVAEYQNQQIAQRAQAQQQQFAAQNGSNPQWWQSGLMAYPNGNSNGNGNGKGSRGQQTTQKKTKKRRRKKRGKHKKDGMEALSEGNNNRASNGMNSNGSHSTQTPQVAVQNMPAIPTISMLNGVATLSNGNLFATNGIPNGIQYSDSTLFQQFAHSQPPQFQPTLSPPTNNTLNGNAASYQ